MKKGYTKKQLEDYAKGTGFLDLSSVKPIMNVRPLSEYMTDDELKHISDYMDKQDREKVMNDLISLGQCAWKAEIENGKPHIRYIDPTEPTLAQLEAIERGELTVEKLTLEQIKERYGKYYPLVY
jgi:hypothetical protein